MATLDEAERRLDRSLPGQLTALLPETNGVVDEYGTDIVWSLDRIVEQNLHFWSPGAFPGLYMPFNPLLFFGDNGGGDQFAFVLTPDRPDIFVWDHESDSRLWAARELADYLHRSLAGEGDWYR
ncbi:SMI1/KNR4 family protein [Streptomyces sp. NPDC048590]|uniref:SMI1/KNR4 family protein n=1 Tax=Streptomyces sp. NPDC048590 TaxID=3365574 RepID=UPI003721A632